MVDVRFSQAWNIYFLFNSDVMNIVLKADRRRSRRPYFVIFVFWRNLLYSK